MALSFSIHQYVLLPGLVSAGNNEWSSHHGGNCGLSCEHAPKWAKSHIAINCARQIAYGYDNLFGSRWWSHGKRSYSMINISSLNRLDESRLIWVLRKIYIYVLSQEGCRPQNLGWVSYVFADFTAAITELFCHYFTISSNVDLSISHKFGACHIPSLIWLWVVRSRARRLTRGWVRFNHDRCIVLDTRGQQRGDL